MSPCDGCGGPLVDDEPCLTCRTLEATRQPPSGLSNERPISANGQVDSVVNLGACPFPQPPSTEDVREVPDTTHDFLRRFLVMSNDGLRVLSLWTFHTST
jgi:hypothetical protein